MRQNKRHCIFTGHIARPHQRYEYQDIMDAIDEQPIQQRLCKHDEYCAVKITINKAHCSEDYALNCQTWKYYEKYGCRIK